MIYLKFMVKKADATETRVICTDSYYCSADDKGLRVYYQDGMWERISDDDWLNCFVMSETGKTIDKIEA